MSSGKTPRRRGSLAFRLTLWYAGIFTLSSGVAFLLFYFLITATLRVMELFRNFDVVFVMFAGGPGNATETLPIAVFRTTIEQQRPGVGAAFSLILIAVMLLIAWFFIALLQRYRTEQ